MQTWGVEDGGAQIRRDRGEVASVRVGSCWIEVQERWARFGGMAENQQRGARVEAGRKDWTARTNEI